MVTKYQPKQRDIIWIDFDPARGYEIKKRRPALVISSDNYHRRTHYAIVVPITSQYHQLPTYYALDEKYETNGQIVTAQIYTFDMTQKAGRKPVYIETLREEDFYQITQLVAYNFEF
jgi:mRNA interferase MazF